MPLPFDLVSVAWLREEGITEAERWAGWGRKREDRRQKDLAVVVRDQQHYIRELEAMVRPGLVERVGHEQAGML